MPSSWSPRSGRGFRRGRAPALRLRTELSSRCGRPARCGIQPERNMGGQADARSVLVVGGQYPLYSAIEPVGGATDVCSYSPHVVELTPLDVLELLAKALDGVQPRLDLLVERGTGGLDFRQHLEEFPALDDHVHCQENGEGCRERRHEEIELMHGQRRIHVAGRGKQNGQRGEGELRESELTLLRGEFRRRRRVDCAERDQEEAGKPSRTQDVADRRNGALGREVRERAVGERVGSNTGEKERHPALLLSCGTADGKYQDSADDDVREWVREVERLGRPRPAGVIDRSQPETPRRR